MAPETQQLFKDIIFNLQAFLYWREQYQLDNQWSNQKNATEHLNRLKELNPQAVEWLRDHDFDDLCG